jgi:hypothetical protein
MATVVTRPTNQYLLEVDGVAVSSLQRFSGLDLKADIVATQTGADPMPKKHVANFSWSPGQAKVGIGMGKGLYGWVKASLEQGSARRDGRFTVADAQGKVQSALDIRGGLLTAFTVPECDAGTKGGAGAFELAFQPEQVKWALASGDKFTKPAARAAKAWASSNFKVSIGNLPCARVAKVGAFTWRSEVVEVAGAGPRRVTQMATRVTVPDIKLTIAAADYPAWAEAARKWFIDGQRTDGDEMQGRITLLDPTLDEAKALGWIDLFNVGFKTFSAPEAEAANQAQTQQFTVELYVEKMALTIKALEA